MRRRRVAPWIAAAVGLVLIFVIVVAWNAKPAEQRVADSPLVGKPAPAVAGDTLSAQTGTLAALRGKWVVVNFFATWCTPCRQEHPELIRFANRHAARGDAAVIQVAYEERAAEVRSFIAKHGGDWPVIDDPKGSIALEWGVRGLPESYLVDPDGVVQAKIIGGATADFIERLL
jgi:cytochrome c biogenesis protein CcmG/thiol:disulfide interchange protein DsbE